MPEDMHLETSSTVKASSDEVSNESATIKNTEDISASSDEKEIKMLEHVSSESPSQSVTDNISEHNEKDHSAMSLENVSEHSLEEPNKHIHQEVVTESDSKIESSSEEKIKDQTDDKEMIMEELKKNHDEITKPVHEIIQEDTLDTSTKFIELSTVENTPSPSTSPHTVSSEHAPTSEPDIEKHEDYDANNDLLDPLDESDKKTQKLLSHKQESSDSSTKSTDVSQKSIKSKNHSASSENLNDIFIQETSKSDSSTTEKSEESVVSSTQNIVESFSKKNEYETVEKDHEKPEHTSKVENTEEKDLQTSVEKSIEDTELSVKRKPEKKTYKNKLAEKEHSSESYDVKYKEEHFKMDRLGIAAGEMPEEDTTSPPTTEMIDSSQESGAGKLDVRFKLDETEASSTDKILISSTEINSTEKENKIDEEMENQEKSREFHVHTTDFVKEESTEAQPTDMPVLEVDSPKNIHHEINEDKSIEKINTTEIPITEMVTEFSDRMDSHRDNDIKPNLKHDDETTERELIEVTTMTVQEDKTEKMPEDMKDDRTEKHLDEKSDVDITLNKTSSENESVTEEITTVISETSSTTSVPVTRLPAPVREEQAPSLPVSSNELLQSSGFSKCTAGQFQCVNGTSHMGPCVSLSSKCDSINDCSDASDELGCIEDGCPGNFQCSNGQCLKRHLVCNGITDCTDASDEANCGNWQCKFDELRCPSGRCIPLLWQCDGKADCENHTDEQNCQATCGNQEYLCPERRCIPLSWRCNGKPDCAQGDDEKLCECSVDEFKCAAGGCVSKSQICDGEAQCPDMSDEWNCLRINNETVQLEVRSANDDWVKVCSDNWDDSWSNAACQSLGYSGSVFTEFPELKEDSGERILKLKPSFGNASHSPFLGSLERAPREVCSSGKVVELTCEDFNCGSQHRTSVAPEARVVGGNQAADGQWPSIVLVYNTAKGSGCTGSIISPIWLLTSFSCLSNKDRSLNNSQWQVYAGGSKFNPIEPTKLQTRDVRYIISHPQARFNRFLYEHDVALVRLSKPFVLNGPNVGAICLTNRNIEPRQLCATAGWGYTSRNARDGSLSQYLHNLPVPTFDLKECNSSKHYNGLISQDHVCAGYTDAERSPCDNDEGAPLMCFNDVDGVWELQGLLSYHSQCGRGFHPSIFTSVPAIRSWVDSTIGSRFAASPAHNVRR